jgi:predicted HD superfamily hydrolase involved in NAD metabolism
MAFGQAEAFAALRGRVSAETLAHSERVAETAAQVATSYGVDPTTARVAGLLHDWCKECDGAGLVAAARRRNLPVTDADLRVPYLLHASVGAAEVREALPGVGADVLDAIAAHTCGAPVMTDLAMVVYIADAIEPGRTHDGVQALRSAVGPVPLHELFARTYTVSFRHLVDARRCIHPVTTAVWNALVAGTSR